MTKQVIWSATAQSQLAAIYKYILKSSLQNAESVKSDIFASTRNLALHPEIYPLDKFRKNNDGSFRAYELHRYRIAYRVTGQHIIIIRIRHSSMEPKSY